MRFSFLYTPEIDGWPPNDLTPLLLCVYYTSPALPFRTFLKEMELVLATCLFRGRKKTLVVCVFTRIEKPQIYWKNRKPLFFPLLKNVFHFLRILLDRSIGEITSFLENYSYSSCLCVLAKTGKLEKPVIQCTKLVCLFLRLVLSRPRTTESLCLPDVWPRWPSFLDSLFLFHLPPSLDFAALSFFPLKFPPLCILRDPPFVISSTVCVCIYTLYIDIYLSFSWIENWALDPFFPNEPVRPFKIGVGPN